MKGTRLAIYLAAISVMFFAAISYGAQNNLDGRYDQSLRKGEVRATLNPDLFGEPNIRKAYQAAKEIPWVLDSIYCYCQCAESPVFRHKSLLSCYVDKHAAM